MLPKRLEKIFSKDQNLFIEMRGFILHTNRYSIRNAIQQGVRQLSTTNHSRFMEDFLESVELFFEKDKCTNIRRF